MNCGTLPDTGAPPTLVLAGVALVCLVVGATLVTLARRERAGPAVLLGLVLLAAGYATATVAPAEAASRGCKTYGPDSLHITQTSVLTGLAPEVAPLTITGRVTNHSDDDTYITAVSVSMTSVTKAANAAAGACEVSDYTLTDARMPVGRALGPHESLTFSGATIGFKNKAVNQDACKHAVIRLHYYSGATPNPAS